MAGRQNALYALPKPHGGTSNLKVEVPEHELEYATGHLVDREDETEHQEYFNMWWTPSILTSQEIVDKYYTFMSS